uniref:Uncharacterized protein n=1 Tax=viral metagenome TaxID=1070528 RepID=A0A6M3KAA0_9ZZZZ
MENSILEFANSDKLLHITNITPSYSMTFSKDGKEAGKLEWDEGVFKFTGEVQESAKVFFDFLKPLVDDYIRSKIGGNSE